MEPTAYFSEIYGQDLPCLPDAVMGLTALTELRLNDYSSQNCSVPITLTTTNLPSLTFVFLEGGALSGVLDFSLRNRAYIPPQELIRASCISSPP